MNTTSLTTPLQLEAKIFKGLADQSRLSILEILSQGPQTVSAIVEETKLSQPNASTHLACLLECGLVKREQQGRQAVYEIAGEEVREVLAATKRILQKHGKEIYDCTRY